MQLHTINFPDLRGELISNVRALSDLEYQKSLWVNGVEYDGAKFGNLYELIEFLFEETTLSDHTFENIGEVLVDHEEASVIEILCRKLEVFFKKYGDALTDNEYISKTEWNDIVEYAKLVLEKLKSNPVKFED